MLFIKMVYNELFKILKRNVIYIFSIIAIILVIISCIVVNQQKKLELDNQITELVSEEDIVTSLSNLKYKLNSYDITDYDKNVILKEIEINNYILENGVKKIFSAKYKVYCQEKLVQLYKKFYSLDENSKERLSLDEKINNLWEIFKTGTFDEYIEFFVNEVEESYKNNEIDEKEYNDEIKRYEDIEKYEVGKFSDVDAQWKENLISFISKKNSILESGFDFESEKKYLDENDIKEIENEILKARYRLENNKPPYFTEKSKIYNINSYSRYTYNNLANKLSIMCIGLFVILISASTISDELTKGTIKFTLINPYSRKKLLIAKLVAIIVLTLILVFIISQISILIGNIVFGANTNEYLYVKDGNVNLIGTYTYEFMQYLLRLPEIIIYLLISITLSSLTKNTAISTIISAVLFIGMPVLIEMLNDYIALDFIRYLLFTNFDFVDRVFKINTYFTLENGAEIYPMSIQYSIFVIGLTAVLLIITVFDSFKKKQI